MQIEISAEVCSKISNVGLHLDDSYIRNIMNKMYNVIKFKIYSFKVMYYSNVK